MPQSLKPLYDLIVVANKKRVASNKDAGSRHAQKSSKPAFHLRGRESIAEGFSRTFNELLGAALAELGKSAQPVDDSVHEIRKAIKKSRALLRLLRPALGGVCQDANAQLRSAGRALSELRDADALVGLVQQIEKNHQGVAKEALQQARSRILRRKREIVRHFTASKEVERISRQLNDVQKAVASWPLEQANAQTVASAIENTVRRGRKAYTRAIATQRSEDFHEVRKRAKDLRYQLKFLSHLWPPVFDGYAESAKQLEQWLGEDHNLVILRETLNGRKSPGGAEMNGVFAALHKEQQRLRTHANCLGMLIYSDKPKLWTRRMEDAWEARKQSKSSHL